MNSTQKPELLAPAGTLEKLKFAVQYGADAVYIAGKQYGLRAFAGNFDKEEMAEGIQFAHERNVKVILDLVVNHTATNHEWFQKFVNAHKEGNKNDPFYELNLTSVVFFIIAPSQMVIIFHEFCPLTQLC